MANLIREEQYVFQLGRDEHRLRVQEMIWGAEWWPEKCRVEVVCPRTGEEMKFYGVDAREAVERAVQYLSSRTFVSSAKAEPSLYRRCN